MLGNKRKAAKVEIAGTGCPKCKLLKASALEAVKDLSFTVEIEEVIDIDTIMEMGVIVTPALAIDGEVKSVGKVLRKEQIKNIIEGEK